MLRSARTNASEAPSTGRTVSSSSMISPSASSTSNRSGSRPRVDRTCICVVVFRTQTWGTEFPTLFNTSGVPIFEFGAAHMRCFGLKLGAPNRLWFLIAPVPLFLNSGQRTSSVANRSGFSAAVRRRAAAATGDGRGDVDGPEPVSIARAPLPRAAAWRNLTPPHGGCWGCRSIIARGVLLAHRGMARNVRILMHHAGRGWSMDAPSQSCNPRDLCTSGM
eukprot:SAG31_NODE_1632_length_7694_cov_12.123239_6_plen_220_part_00